MEHIVEDDVFARVCLCRGVEVKEPIEVGTDVWLYPPSHLPDNDARKVMFSVDQPKNSAGIFPRGQKTVEDRHNGNAAALVIFSASHQASPNDTKQSEERAEASQRSLDDARRAIQLASEGLISVAAEYFGKWRNERFFAYGFRFDDGAGQFDRPCALEDIPTYYSKLQRSPNAEKCRIAIDRLSSARRYKSFEDQMIDLGIALEALVIDEKGSEITYRARTRVAWLLGADPASRREHFVLAGQLYELRSEAVHNGIISTKLINKHFSRSRTFDDMIMRSIKAVLSSREKIAWDSMVFG